MKDKYNFSNSFEKSLNHTMKLITKLEEYVTDKKPKNNLHFKQEEFHLSNIFQLETLKEQRRMHYDLLLWTVSLILITPISGLLMYTLKKENPDLWLMLIGFGLTFAVYFAASFRELRSRLNKPLCEENLTPHSLNQWRVYVLIFCILEVYWTILLIDNYPNHYLAWLLLLGVALVGMIYLYFKTRINC